MTNPNVAVMDVPEAMVRAALKVYCGHCSLTVGREPLSDHEQQVREMLAGVLPLYEQQVRERVALELERMSNKRDQAAELNADERSPLLGAQSDVLWDAARLVRAGKDVG